MFIEPIEPEAATGAIADIYAAESERWGFLPTFVQAFSHHPEAYGAWLQLITTVYGGMDRRRCELATLAAARTLKSTCCSVAHGKFLADRFFTSDEVVAIASDHRHAEVDDVDKAVMSFAEKVARDSSSITQSDVDELTSRGLDDREVFDVVFAVAARSFFATVIEALGTTAESQFVEALGPSLVDALTVGRPAS